MADKQADLDKAEEHQFLPDDVSNIIKEACSTVLDNQVYDPSKVRSETHFLSTRNGTSTQHSWISHLSLSIWMDLSQFPCVHVP